MQKAFSLLSGLSLLVSTSLGTLTGNPFEHTVCIDPGHGGDDPGAINNELTEAAVNLNIAEKLKTLLANNHYNVVMTRDNNTTTLTNTQRADICNEHHADMAVAIHLNSSTDETIDYTQGLYGTKQKDKKLTDTLHHTLVTELPISNPPNDDPTTDFADNFLLKTQMPATLQETVFISSSTEYTQLETGKRQQAIAKALFDGITKWFNQES